MDDQKAATRSEGRKLYKSSADRIIDGVCGGIAEYFEIDTSVVRLLLVALSIFSFGAGILFYIVAMLVIPMRPLNEETEIATPRMRYASSAGATAALVSGIIIVIIGITLLFNYYSIFSVTSLWNYFGRLALPVVFILMGGALLLGREKKKSEPSSGPDTAPGSGAFKEILDEGTFVGVEKKRLIRSVRERKIAGVCGGLADYLNVDPTVVRFAFVILAFASFGLAAMLYIVCSIVIPKEVTQ